MHTLPNLLGEIPKCETIAATFISSCHDLRATSETRKTDLCGCWQLNCDHNNHNYYLFIQWLVHRHTHTQEVLTKLCYSFLVLIHEMHSFCFIDSWWIGGLTLRGMLSSQSGKLITLAALPTHSTTTVANICTHIQQQKNYSLLSGEGCVCLQNRCTKWGKAFNLLVRSRRILKKGTCNSRVKSPLVLVSITGGAHCS